MRGSVQKENISGGFKMLKRKRKQSKTRRSIVQHVESRLTMKDAGECVLTHELFIAGKRLELTAEQLANYHLLTLSALDGEHSGIDFGQADISGSVNGKR